MSLFGPGASIGGPGPQPSAHTSQYPLLPLSEAWSHSFCPHKEQAHSHLRAFELAPPLPGMLQPYLIPFGHQSFAQMSSAQRGLPDSSAKVEALSCLSLSCHSTLVYRTEFIAT